MKSHNSLKRHHHNPHTNRFSFSLLPEKCNFTLYPAQWLLTDTRNLHTEAKPNPTHKGCFRGVRTIHTVTTSSWSLPSQVNVTKVQNAGNSVTCAQLWSDYLTCQLTVLGYRCNFTQSTLRFISSGAATSHFCSFSPKFCLEAEQRHFMFTTWAN